jgi:hypothetical protein
MIDCIGHFVLDNNGAIHVPSLDRSVFAYYYVYFGLIACKISCKRVNLRWCYYVIVKFTCS